MKFLTVDIDDRNLVVSDGQRIATAPGYARVGKKLVFGEAARSAARLYPAEVNNRFWRSLGRISLPVSSSTVRDHADLAWRQLRELLDPFESEVAIIVPPSHYDDDQLSLLLGIASSLELRVPSLVRRALLVACRQGLARSARVVERQLHLTVITNVDLDQNRVSTGATEQLEGAGTLDVLHRVAHFLQRRFIESTRFDPLHNAGTEQQLYDRLPEWLESLAQHNRVAVSLSHADQHYSSFLTRDDVREATRDVIGTLIRALRNSDLPVLVDAETAWYLQLHGFDPSAVTVFRSDTDAICRELSDQLLEFEDTVLLESLVLPETASAAVGAATSTPAPQRAESPDPEPAPATRYALLDSGYRAFVADQLQLTVAGSRLAVARSGAELELGRVCLENGTLWLDPVSRDLLVNGAPVTARTALNPGDRIDYQPCRSGLTVIQFPDDENPAA